MGFNQLIGALKRKKWIKNGLVVGDNVKFERGVSIDPSFPWLVKIGDNVTIAPDTIVLAHDASSQVHLGYTRLGKVIIGDNVFIGTKCVILPGVTIGNNVVIAAGSVVSKNVRDNVVVGGVPAKVIKELSDFKERQQDYMDSGAKWDESYTIYGGITETKKEEMLEYLDHGNGYIR